MNKDSAVENFNFIYLGLLAGGALNIPEYANTWCSWEVNDVISWDVINFIDTQRPGCQLWLGDNACSFPDPREILRLQHSPCLVALTISLYACEIKAFKLLQQTILTCRKLRTLDLDIWFQNTSFEFDEPKIYGFKLKPNEKFPPLKSLSLSGFYFGSSLEAKGTWREAIDLAQLTSLTLHDDAFPWWQEPALSSLKSFKAKMPKQLGTDIIRSPLNPDFHCFFSQNKNLEILDLSRFSEKFDFAWLKPVGPTLKTLRLHEFTRTIEVKNRHILLPTDLHFLGRNLPNLRNLKLDIGASEAWPYEMLTTIALAFPMLTYLTVHISYLVGSRQASSLPNVIDNCQLAKMTRIASSWSHLWNILSGKYCCLSQQQYEESTNQSPFYRQEIDQTTQTHGIPLSQREPLLKSLVVMIGPPSSPESQAFRVTVSERVEDGRRGEAFVISQDVEDIVQQMKELPTRSIQSKQFGEMCQNLLQARRKAEIGFFDKNEEGLVTSESWHWGSKRSVIPEEDAHVVNGINLGT